MCVKNSEEPIEWFALSAPYRNELKAKALLDEQGVENYLPMQHKIVTDKKGKKVRKLMPVVSNLLFAHTTRTHLQEIKTGVHYLQYRTRVVNGRNVPIVVPDYQMKQFIAVCDTRNEQLIFLTPQEINLSKGTPVRVIGGMFDGVEGLFLKVKGVRSRRVVVQVDGIAVATAEIEPQYIEVIQSSK